MDKKEIQKQRMMNYFIEGAKKIIREEGIKDLNIRKISDNAGYSHTTLYNYFQNVDEVLIYCIIDFQKECHEFVVSKKHPADETDRLKSIVLSITEYFLKNPNVFRLIFMMEFEYIHNEKLKEADQLVSRMTHAPAALEIYQSLARLAETKRINPGNIPVIGNMIRMNFIGKLLLHITGRFPYKNNTGLLKNLSTEMDHYINSIIN